MTSIEQIVQSIIEEQPLITFGVLPDQAESIKQSIRTALQSYGDVREAKGRDEGVMFTINYVDRNIYTITNKHSGEILESARTPLSDKSNEV